MSRKVTLAPGEFYHIYNRGTDKRRIFFDRADYNRFLSLIYLCNTEKPADLKVQGRALHEIRDVNRGPTITDMCTYCLMPNHFHFLLREKDEGGISRFMQKLTTGYTMYFNKRRERTGALFEGVFKARRAGYDQYLKYLVSYIHLNPIKLIEPNWKETGISNKQRAEDYLEEYLYSSYLDYRGIKRRENQLLTMDALPEYFSDSGEFKELVTTWLAGPDEVQQGETL